MKFVSFFIERPVTAIVINAMLVICGLLAFFSLTVDEYPKIVVPKLTIRVILPNASSETIEKEVTDPLEQGLAKIGGITKMISESSDQESRVQLYFSHKISMDKAVSLVNEELLKIKSILPKEAREPELRRVQDEGSLYYLGLKSSTLRGAALAHFANVEVKNHFSGLDGVAEARVLGPAYAMRISLDQVAMHSQKVDVFEVIKVLKESESMLSAGTLNRSEPISFDVVPKSSQDYEGLIVHRNDRVPVFLRDIANIELVQDERNLNIKIDGQDAVMIEVKKSADANILEVANAVKKLILKLNTELKGQIVFESLHDQSIFVRESLGTIYRTIFEACLLVLFIILIFLRNLKAILIPLITIPISLIGTFLALKIFNASINTITLLAMVLAVGLVVDDAIVILENIFRYIENGLSPKEAAKKGGEEIGFAIIAMTLTLVAVFLPLAFVSDLSGELLKEFAIALSSAVLFSGVTALTLSPLMCAFLLKHEINNNKISLKIEKFLNKIEQAYKKIFTIIFEKKLITFLSLFVLIIMGIFLYKKIPQNLLPKEDRGFVGVFIPHIAGFTVEDMEPYVDQVEEILLRHEEKERILTFGFMKGTNLILPLKKWQNRKKSQEDLVNEIRKEVSIIPSANIWPWGLDTGLEALKEDDSENAQVVIAFKTTKPYVYLEEHLKILVEKWQKEGLLQDVRKDLSFTKKTHLVTPDREQMASLGITETQISLALQAFSDRISPVYYKYDGQRYQVYIDSQNNIESINDIYIKTAGEEEILLSAIATTKEMIKPESLKHFGQMRTANVFANIPKGKSLSDVERIIDEGLSEVIPHDITPIKRGALAMKDEANRGFLLLFLAGLIFIFAIMAIQFESFFYPFIILLTVPMALIGAIFFLWLFKADMNIYTQLGMLTLIGLITKHGILLTEFIKQKLHEGFELKKAIFMAVSLRFRPILMTTLCTILGALPLITQKGAGMEARSSLGIVIVGGMILGTILTLFVLPVIIYVFKKKV